MGSIPALPMPPQVGGGGGISSGGTMPNQALQSPGVLPFQPNPVASTLAASAGFMQQLRDHMMQVRQYHMQQYEEGVKQLQLGIPMDVKKIAMHAKKAGLDIDTNEPSPAETQYAALQKQQTAGTEALANSPTQNNPMLIGGPQAAQGAMTAGQPSAVGATPPPPATPPPQPGLMERFAQAMGMKSPEVGANSPAVQALTRLGQTGQAGAEEEGLKAKNRLELQKLYTKAVKGDPQAMATVARAGLVKSMPLDDWIEAGSVHGETPEAVAGKHLWMMGGGPQMKQIMLDLAEKQSPYFRNAQGGPDMQGALVHSYQVLNGLPVTQQPGRSFEQDKQVADIAHGFEELYGTQPNIAQFVAEAQVSGDPAKALPLLKYISDNAAGETLGSKRHGLDMMQFGLANETHLFDIRKFSQEMDLHNREFNLSTNQALAKNYGDVYERARTMMNDPNATQQEKEAGAKMLVEAVNATNGLTVPIADRNGKVVDTKHFGVGDLTTDRFFNIIGPSNYLYGRPSAVFKSGKVIDALKQQYSNKAEGMNAIRKAVSDAVEENNPGVSQQQKEAITESMMSQANRWMPQSLQQTGQDFMSGVKLLPKVPGAAANLFKKGLITDAQGVQSLMDILEGRKRTSPFNLPDEKKKIQNRLRFGPDATTEN